MSNVKHETIHGLPIIAMFATSAAAMTRPGRIVLVDKGNGQFVVSWQGWDHQKPGWDDGWLSGSYFDSKEKAWDLFAERVKKEISK